MVLYECYGNSLGSRPHPLEWHVCNLLNGLNAFDSTPSTFGWHAGDWFNRLDFHLARPHSHALDIGLSSAVSNAPGVACRREDGFNRLSSTNEIDIFDVHVGWPLTGKLLNLSGHCETGTSQCASAVLEDLMDWCAGNWCNSLNYHGQTDMFGQGLPVATKRREIWPRKQPLFANPAPVEQTECVWKQV